MTIDSAATWIGYAVMVGAGAAVAAGVVIGAVMAFNRATWRLVDMYGGIKTFCRFRAWYWDQPENKKKA